MQTKSHLTTRMLTEGAMMVAISQVLSYVKLYELPNGGSITPDMIAIPFFAVRWGLGPGLMAGFVYGLLQMLTGGIAVAWQSLLLDYVVAFTPLGLAGLFKGKKWGLFAGIVLGCAGRFLAHFISGITVWRIVAPTEVLNMEFSDPCLYSLVYNGSYMLLDTLIALVIAAALYRPLRKFILGEDLR